MERDRAMAGKTRTESYRSDSLWVRFLWEVREQSRTSVPCTLGLLLYKGPFLLSLRFVGNIGSKELAAAALATTLCNVTGMSLSVGLSSALTTLTGQARGDLMARQAEGMQEQSQSEPQHDEEKKEDEALLPAQISPECGSIMARIRPPLEGEEAPLLPLTYLYRGLAIQLGMVVPVGLWWIYGIKPVLVALGQGEEMSEMTQSYLRILSPGLWSYSINWTLTAWLQAIEMADIPAYAAAVGLILHVPFNLLFIYGFGWGYLGVACATVIFQILQPILMFSYLFATRQGQCRVLANTFADAVNVTKLTFWKEAKLAVKHRKGILQYLSLALPGIVIISEWWASELTIFLAGLMSPSPALALAGMTIYQSINTLCFMFSVGVSIAGSTRVGSALGAGDVKGADFAAKISVLSSAILSTIMGSTLYFTPHTLFPSFFSPDPKVQFETSRTIPFLAVYIFADGVQVALNGIIKGCGRQFITMPVVVIAYWFVGVPLAYYIAFVRHDGDMLCEDDSSFTCGIPGLVAGITTGTWVHMLLLLFIVVCTTDWFTEAELAKKRLAHDKGDGHEAPISPVVRKDEAIEMGIVTQ